MKENAHLVYALNETEMQIFYKTEYGTNIFLNINKINCDNATVHIPTITIDLFFSMSLNSLLSTSNLI